MEQPKNTTDVKFAEGNDHTITPEVTWAQRSSKTDAERNHIFLAVNVPDVDPKKIKLDVQPQHLDFTGYSETKKAKYHVKIDFYAEIDPAHSKINHNARCVEMVLQKKELDAAFWPRLLKDNKKVHYLKTDFDKWVDEDEQDEAPEEDDYMSRMGGMGGGMGGMGGDGGFGGIDFSKIGGGAMGAGEEEDEDEEDEEMPGLEGEIQGETKGGASAADDKLPAGTSKIEEME